MGTAKNQEVGFEHLATDGLHKMTFERPQVDRLKHIPALSDKVSRASSWIRAPLVLGLKLKSKLSRECASRKSANL
jgi:hypothetical protein